MGQVENNARCIRLKGYKIIEDIDVSKNDFQTLLDELTDAKNSLVQHNGYMPRQWVFGMIRRVPGHLLEENPDLPNLDPEGRFNKIAEMRQKCRMAAIETEANAKIRKSLNDLNGLLGFRVFLDCFRGLFNVFFCKSRVEKVHTHQQYKLVDD